MTPALILALTLMTAAPPPADGGEPLPPGAPTQSYELSAWCFGALNEYLQIYEKVKPDLRDIDHMFGTSVIEDQPYQQDMAAAHVELKMIGDSVTAAEKASPQPIADRGVAAMRQGQAIWSVVEGKTSRELARAWLSWALPDRCDSNARELAARSILFGKVLRYNATDKTRPPPPAPESATSPPPASPLPQADAPIFRPTEVDPLPSVAASPNFAPAPETAAAAATPAAPRPTTAPPPAEEALTAPEPSRRAETAAAAPEGAISPQVLDAGPPAAPATEASAPTPAPTRSAVATAPASPPPRSQNPDESQEPTL